MVFRIADTFTDSLARLTNEEQKAVKTTAFDLQMNPTGSGLSFHRVDRAKDPNFWSVRVSRDIRIIVHKTESSFLLCYVDHHDGAYQWAVRRKLERHPKTGAAQIVEIRETVKEIVVPRYVEIEEPTAPKPALFADRSGDELLSYGVPAEWIDDVQKANEDSLFDLAEHLPAEAAEALLDLATGAKPKVAAPIPPAADAFEHPDAQRRFRVMEDVEELERALDAPWEKWAVFLHPAQREVVERDYSGPARVAGSAGTGKTIVALHRAVHLAQKDEDARVLLTTFSDALANSLRGKLRLLIGNQPRLAERLEVHSMGAVGRRLYETNLGPLKLVSPEVINELLSEAASASPDQKFSTRFLQTEWAEVVDAWQLKSWEEYRDVLRLGRKTRLAESQRAALWQIFDRLRTSLDDEGLMTEAGMFARLAEHLSDAKHPPYEYAVVDEAQDINVAELRFLAALGGNRPNSLFFAGDLGQRIFRLPFSWKALGVEIQGRSSTLRINYRTSHQIRSQADRLLPPQLADVDGNVEDRRDAMSVFNGPPPMVATYETPEAETTAVSGAIQGWIKGGLEPNDIAIFVRSENELDRARETAEPAGHNVVALDERLQTSRGKISLATMHQAKGLEFRAVVVMACDDEVIPLQSRIETVTDASDLDDVYQTERHLLYVACTRARDHLMVTGVEPGSEFLEDLTGD